ncbi:4'-phosphopantetheinyl transferase superfamily protein [Novosphingobium sp. fls2-241-R2A-195]|uniref:4'-phosphopantetheinyl transferase family protein n=1 Tax=Novosphingobium sp. fls2-241-R2A-195 TaxID=3040296 RepID=UPI00254B21B9|nr:4'-phosphopantetheinyl transferase superfamily protein [Novosphingobium sp. fls2-241-R2A-195]
MKAMGEDFIATLARHGIIGERIAAPFVLWLVRPDTGDQAAVSALLSDAEAERAGRFRIDALARRYRAAHGALRLLVEAEFGIAAARQRYGANEFGKPHLLDEPDVQCNVSYSGDFAMVALARGVEIGIDLERVRPVDDAAGLAAMYYTDRELMQLNEGPGAFSDHEFLTVWVRKEACSKALGRGLSIAPSSFECGVGCGPRNVLVDGEVVESDVVDPKGGVLMSWAVRGQC